MLCSEAGEWPAEYSGQVMSVHQSVLSQGGDQSGKAQRHGDSRKELVQVRSWSRSVKIRGWSQEPPRPSMQPPRTLNPFLLTGGSPDSPDPSLLQLSQAGISFEDSSDGLLLLLCQEAEVQQSLSDRFWPICHGERGQGPKPLLRCVASLGHQLGLCPSWAYVASWG